MPFRFLSRVFNGPWSAESRIDDRRTTQELCIELESQKEQLEKFRIREKSLDEARLLAGREAQEYLRALERANKQLRASEKAQLFGSEKIRRLSELLQNAEETAAAIRKENNILISHIATLQGGVQTLTDDDIQKEMTVLYHDLEQWTLKRIKASAAAKSDFDFSNVENAVAEMQSSLSALIHQNFWTSEFVGSGTEANQHMTDLTNVIGSRCPIHVLQHWRFAMSMSILDLGTPNLMGQCDFITQQVGYHGALTVTETNQLKEILGRCIELKARLEYQEARYTFWNHIADSPFRSDFMRNPLKEDAVGEVVEYTLWPAIYKEASNGHLVVQKAVVRTVAPHT